MSVHAVASQFIRAAPERVMAIYRDYGHWPQVFPATIRGTRLIRENNTTKAIEQTRDIYAFLFENLGVEYK